MSKRPPPGDYLGYGTWIQRNAVSTLSSTGEVVDIIRVPAFGDTWLYELPPGQMGGEAVQTAVRIYQEGVAKGIEEGERRAQLKMRQAMGLDTKP